MPIPKWSEMPPSFTGKKIGEEDLEAAAKIRNTHRAAMAVRWRIKKVRAEDKEMGRLPDKWHEWMACPAAEYLQENKDGSYICVCDSWEHAGRRKRSSEIKFDQWRELMRSEAALSVKSIDTDRDLCSIPEIITSQESLHDRSEPSFHFLSGGVTTSRGPDWGSKGPRPKRRGNRIRCRLRARYQARSARSRNNLLAV